MKLSLFTLGAIAPVSGLTAWANLKADSDTGKVVEMLNEMIGKGTEEKEKEASLFKEITSQVTGKIAETKGDIKNLKEKIERYSAAASSASTESDRLAEEIGTEQATNDANTSELATRTEEYKAAKKDNDARILDLEETVNALTWAIDALKSQPKSLPAEFLQTVMKKVPAAKADLEAFLEQPQATKTAYENQSGGILELLAKMKGETEKDLQAARTGAMNETHAFEMYKSNKENEIAGLDKSIADKSAEKARQDKINGEKTAAANKASSELSAAQKVLKETKAYFAAQESAFKQNQTTRANELKALTEAVEIISGKPLANEAKHAEKLKDTVGSFLQVASRSSNDQQRQLLKQAANLLNERNANKLNNKSKYLAMVSVQVMTGGPFDKIINMIEDLLTRLEEEKAAEATHHAWCQEELKATKEDMTKAQQAFDNKKTEKEDLEGQKTATEEDQAELNDQIASLTKELAEATASRNAEKAENEEVIADAKASQEALSMALDKLNEFYKKASLLQEGAQQPTIEAYGGMGGSATGVIGLLETVQAKFAEMEAEHQSQEQLAQKEYNTLKALNESQIEKKKESVQANKVKLVKLEANIKRAAKALKKLGESLGQVQTYWEELQPMCTVKHVSYEERVQMRQEEIAALKEAYEVLQGMS